MGYSASVDCLHLIRSTALTFVELRERFPKLLESSGYVGQTRSSPKVLLFQSEFFSDHVIVLPVFRLGASKTR